MKHTQGPWRLSKVVNGYYVSGTDNLYIADVHGWTGRDENESETTANASLIAIAPEMLAMLEKLFHLHENGQWHDEVGILIQKAKGE